MARPGMVMGMRDDGTPCELEGSGEPSSFKQHVLTRGTTVPTLYADARTRTKPATVAVTAEQGGEWITWELPWQKRPQEVHSIKFADGSVWDAVNGWRDKS